MLNVPETPRELAIYIALSHLGTWYSWGGDDPYSFDCSGLMVEVLKTTGKIQRGEDYSAHGLSMKFQSVPESQVKPGCMICYGSASNPSQVVHIEMVIMPGYTIGASGGGSKTRTREDAIRDNAFVKIRPINRKRIITCYIDPFWEEGDKVEFSHANLPNLGEGGLI